LSLPERIFNHGGNKTFEDSTAELQARIGVDLDQPNLEILINHEIQPKHLEVILSPLWIKEEAS